MGTGVDTPHIRNRQQSNVIVNVIDGSRGRFLGGDHKSIALAFLAAAVLYVEAQGSPRIIIYVKSNTSKAAVLPNKTKAKPV